MSDFPIWQGGGRAHSAGGEPTISMGKAVTASSSANTKGSWIEMIASAPFPGAGLFVHAHTPNTNGLFLFDVGIGGAGSERVVIPDVLFRAMTKTTGVSAFFPFEVGRGERVAMRCQGTSGNSLIRFVVTLVPAGPGVAVPYQRYHSLGTFNSGASEGTIVDPGAVAHTKGAWTEVVASTTRALHLLWLMATKDVVSGDIASRRWLIDVGVGAASSESVLIGDIPGFLSDFVANMHPILCGPFPVNLPVGTRLSARAQCSTGNVNERELNLAFLGAG